MKFQEIIKQKRIALGESQETFGKRFEVSHAAVSDWESGKSEARYEVLYFCLDISQEKMECLGEIIPVNGGEYIYIGKLRDKINEIIKLLNK